MNKSMKTAIILIILFNAFIFVFMYRLRSPEHPSLATTKKVDERQLNPEFTTKVLERLRTSTKLERLLFAMCIFYGTCMLIFKIIGA